MADWIHPLLQPDSHFKKVEILKTDILGHGSYGAVYKAKCDQLVCAAKILHPTVADPQDPGSRKIIERFEQECEQLRSIRHPNIVQYLGVCTDPESHLPILLMELIDESLTLMLERSQSLLLPHIQIDLCYDIAQALAHLHSNNIFHRDLSSNNVLIVAGQKAKVTDFGMSKILHEISHKPSLTVCPGTAVYMPPEALKHSPHYSDKIDCFSFGVLTIQICTCLWPEPGPPTREVPCPSSPSGTLEIPILETERRKNHLDLIDHGNPLLPIATQCLTYNEGERPSAIELCTTLAGVKQSSQYKESVEHVNTSHAGQLVSNLKKNKQGEFEPKESNHKVGREFKFTRQVEHCQAEDTCTTSTLHLEWRQGEDAPIKLVRGGTATRNNMVYFYDESGVMACFDSTTKAWYVLPSCPLKHGSIVTIQGFTSVIGGYIEPDFITNTLLSLVDDKRWENRFPPMPTHRSDSIAVVNGEHLIVAGGTITGSAEKNVYIVEVLYLNTMQWMRAADLPCPLGRASATVCKNHIYIVGGKIGQELSKSVYSCSLDDILSSCIESSDGFQLKKTSAWEQLASLPGYSSTSISINNELLAIGGEGEVLSYKTVYWYCKTSNSWKSIGNMLARRYLSLVEILPDGDLIVVGGYKNIFSKTATVQFGTLSEFESGLFDMNMSCAIS